MTRRGPFSPVFSGWRATAAASGGMLMELHIHDLDCIRWLAGEALSVYAAGGRITGTADFDDFNFVVLHHEGGVLAALDASMASSLHEYRMVVQGTDGTLLHDVTARSVTWLRAGGEQETLTYENDDVIDAYRLEIESFVECALDGSTPAVVGWDGRQAVAMAQGAYESARLGAAVDLSGSARSV